MVAHESDRLSPREGHVAFTSLARRAGTLDVPTCFPQEDPMSTTRVSPYVRTCALGGLVALVTGFLSGFLSA
jgi:hypothetical protein